MINYDQVQYREVDQIWIAFRKLVLEDRNQLPELFLSLKREVPEEVITGPPFCIIQFVTSITDGYDVEICFPVQDAFGETSDLTRLLPGREVLAMVHEGPIPELGSSYRSLFAWAAERGVISDEFCQEIYLDPEDLNRVEIQFVIHPWERLLENHLSRVLGEEAASQVASGREALTVFSSLADRFQWVQNTVTNLERAAEDGECYEVLSGCAHVFLPARLLSCERYSWKRRKRRGIS